ncbi:MAG: RNA polymerase sigma factor RpoD [Oscillospiraceae bacterium]|nr:RNA polymerase sigma factor RpoD [Oscillospiraceae bacterium]
MKNISTVRELIDYGKKNGNKLSSTEINEFLDNTDFADDEIEKLYDSLKNARIDVDNSEEEIITQNNIEKFEKTLASEGVSVDDPVKVYLKEIGNIPLLTSQDEVDISKEVERGRYAEEMLRSDGDSLPEDVKAEYKKMVRKGETARKRLTESNLRLVVSVAKRYVNRGMGFLDLIQEGNIGLLKAVEKFDYSKGYKFSTYATWWIRQAITRALADQSRTIRIPVHMVETINRIKKIQGQLIAQNDTEPTPEEIAEAAGLSVEKVNEILKVGLDPLSLDATVGDEDDTTLGDFVSDSSVETPDGTVEISQLRSAIDEVLSALNEREAFVLKLRFGLDDGEAKTLEEVGQVLGVTRERVRQIEAKALRKIRHPQRSKILVDFYE